MVVQQRQRGLCVSDLTTYLAAVLYLPFTLHTLWARHAQKTAFDGAKSTDFLAAALGTLQNLIKMRN